MKKYLITAVLVLLAFATLGAFGEDRGYGYGEWKNPLYPDTELRPLVKAADPDSMDLTRDGTGYMSESDAAVTLRGMMKRRAENVTLCVVSSKSSGRTLFAELMEAAQEHTGDPKEGDYIRWTLGGYRYMYYYGVNEDGMTEYEYEITFTYYTTYEQEMEMDSAVAALMEELDLSGKTEYKKIRTIYDYITANVKYDYARLNDDSYRLKYTAYAALINGTSVCQGYANLFYRLALEAGVDARLVYGDGGGAHSWNIAGINGEYYLLDATWDAGSEEYWWFLKGTEDFPDHVAESDFMPRYALSNEDYADVVADGLCGDGITWTLEKGGLLTVRGSGDMESYGGDAPWNEWSSRILSVEIGSGVTSVGAGAFAGCTALREVVFGEDVSFIGDGAFPAGNETLYVACGSYPQAWAKVNGYENLTDFPELSFGYVSSGHGDVIVFERTEPGCTEEGYTEGTACLVCGDTVIAQQVIPATGHTEEIDPALDPTCTEIGMTQGVHCTVCGAILVSQETIPAMGHAEEIDPAKDPTCTEPGVTQGVHCAVCGEVLVLQEAVPALGHDWHVVYDADEAAGTVTAHRVCRRDPAHTETETRRVTFVTLPAGIMVVAAEAYEGTAFTAILVPDGATAIGDYAFAYCEKLLYIRIPASVTIISDSAFTGTENVWIDRGR